MIKFKTFKPYIEYDDNERKLLYPATFQLNEWLEENPNIEIISWQTTAVGSHEDYELCITIQYKEKE